MTHLLAFATNFKAETPYLAEWLEYHHLVGVDHFYLYDQDGGAEAAALLRSYEAAGWVTRHPWTHLDGTRYDGPTRFYQRNKNHMAFAHCAQHYRGAARWLMKIDVDEFLCPPPGSASVRPFLEQLAKEPVRGLRLARFDFGSAGHLAPPGGLVIAAYLRREASPSNHKDMAAGPCLSANRFCYSAHWWRYRPRAWTRRLLRVDPDTGLRLNHYATKSLDEYLRRQNVSRGRDATPEGFAARNAGRDAVEDRALLRFAPQVEQQLKQRADRR